MVIRCCVPGCQTKGNSGFHSFPADKENRLRWIENTKTHHLQENHLPNSFRKVCKHHFRPEDYQKHANGLVRLRYNSVPSLNLPHQKEYYSVSDSLLHYPDVEINHNAGQEMEVLVEDMDVVLDDASREKPEATNPQSSRSRLREKYQKMLKEYRTLANRLLRSQKEVKRLRLQLKENKLTDNNVTKYLCYKFNCQQLVFFKMQIENSKKKSHGERYSDEQKSFSLALYKQSPKCYRFMRKNFKLPSKATLGRHSANLVFNSGVNANLFALITKKAKTLPDINKICAISWDEQALKAHVHYNQSKDLIDGFVDSGPEIQAAFATHALTFMIRGINIPYKQAIVYFLTAGLKGFELAELVRLVTEAVFDTGLIVITSVCDQTYVNASAIQHLIGSKPKRGAILKYKIRNTIITHCYDPPHLIKSIRNNAMTKNLQHCISKRWEFSNSNNIDKRPRTLLASWDDVSYVYEFDLHNVHRMLPKITNEHIKPSKRKMEVSVATQVFSQTFGNFMISCSESGHFPKDLSGTAQALLFFNDVFDSINGSNHPQNDTLKGSVNKHSMHFTYWKYALAMLAKMNFVEKETGVKNNKSTVIFKLMSTIKGYVEISQMCLNLNMNNVSIRYNYHQIVI